MPTAAGDKLELGQVRRLLRLIREAQEIHEDRDRSQHLVAGVVRIVGAAVGGALLDFDFTPQGRGAMAPIALVGWDSATTRGLTVLAERGRGYNPILRALMPRVDESRAGYVHTATERELLGQREWRGSPYVEEYLHSGHLDHALYSVIPREKRTVVHGLGFYREKGDRPFTEEERNLVKVFHLECEEMLRPVRQDAGAASAPCPEPAGVRRPELDRIRNAQLSPRERQTLDLLLAGLADKEIAERLRISPYTVNHYTKSIYRGFQVRSRGELLARFLER